MTSWTVLCSTHVDLFLIFMSYINSGGPSKTCIEKTRRLQLQSFDLKVWPNTNGSPSVLMGSHGHTGGNASSSYGRFAHWKLVTTYFMLKVNDLFLLSQLRTVILIEFENTLWFPFLKKSTTTQLCLFKNEACSISAFWCLVWFWSYGYMSCSLVINCWCITFWVGGIKALATDDAVWGEMDVHGVSCWVKRSWMIPTTYIGQHRGLTGCAWDKTKDILSCPEGQTNQDSQVDI